jgi:hypothetical protein
MGSAPFAWSAFVHPVRERISRHFESDFGSEGILLDGLCGSGVVAHDFQLYQISIK